MAHHKIRLSDAEAELIELVRSDRDFGLMLMNKDGEWLVTVTKPPFETAVQMIGVAAKFSEAWAARKPVDPTAVRD